MLLEACFAHVVVVQVLVAKVADLALVNVETGAAIGALAVSLLARTVVSVGGGHAQVLTRQTILQTRHRVGNARRIGVLVRAVGTVGRSIANTVQTDAGTVSAPEVANSALRPSSTALLVAIVLAVFVAVAPPTESDAPARAASKLFLAAYLRCCVQSESLAVLTFAHRTTHDN